MVNNGVIEPANFKYIHNVVVVVKKDGAGEGMNRLCINYTSLNRKMIVDQFLLPRIDEMLTLFNGCQYFTVIDLAAAYWQVKLRPQDRHKIAFLTSLR